MKAAESEGDAGEILGDADGARRPVDGVGGRAGEPADADGDDAAVAEREIDQAGAGVADDDAGVARCPGERIGRGENGAETAEGDVEAVVVLEAEDIVGGG